VILAVPGFRSVRIEAGGETVAFFEEQPWLLVPLILTVVLAYDGLKWAIRRTFNTRPGVRTAQEK
jgi:hypothetical protein